MTTDEMTKHDQALQSKVDILVHSWFAVDYDGGDITDKELNALTKAIVSLIHEREREAVEGFSDTLINLKNQPTVTTATFEVILQEACQRQGITREYLMRVLSSFRTVEEIRNHIDRLLSTYKSNKEV
jgi:hypothetical protein